MEIHWRILGAVVLWVNIMLRVLFTWNKKKKTCHEHKKTVDLINKKALLTKKKSCCIMSQVTNKTETTLNRHDQTKGNNRVGFILPIW
jgi:hypothetical protein